MQGRLRIRMEIALLALVVTAGTACDVMFQGMNAQASDTWKRSYTLGEGGQVEVQNVNGMIEVTPSADATTVEVLAERRARAGSEDAAREALKNIKMIEQVNPKRIALGIERTATTGSFGRTVEITFHLRVPRSAAVKVNTQNGEVRVVGVAGAVEAETTNGGIVGESLGGSVKADTTNGSVRIQVTAVQPDGIRLETTNGSVELQVPADTKANVSAHWANGGFEATGLNPEGEHGRRSFEGKLNGGGPQITLRTTNGRIRISS